jgi:hypothetical protein
VPSDHSRRTGATALLVIRVWRESGQLRARVNMSSDIEQEPPRQQVTASLDELRTLVDDWLAQAATGE